MKRFLIIGICLISASAFGQRSKFKELPKAIIKLSPQHLVRNGLRAGVEFFNESHRFSNEILIEGIYSQQNVFDDPAAIGKLSSSGFIVEYGFKYYVSGLKVNKTLFSERVSGFYVGMGVQGGSYKEVHGINHWPKNSVANRYDQVGISSQIFNFNVIGGVTKEVAERVYIDAFIGAGVQTGGTKISTDKIDIQEITNRIDGTSGAGLFTRGVIPRVGIKLGIAI